MCIYAHTRVYIYTYVYSVLRNLESFLNHWLLVSCGVVTFGLLSWSLLAWKVLKVSSVESFACPKVNKAQRRFDYCGLSNAWMFFYYFTYLHFVLFFFFFFGYKTVGAGFLSSQFRPFLLSVWNECLWETSSRNSGLLPLHALECSENIFFGIFRNNTAYFLPEFHKRIKFVDEKLWI